MIVSIRRRTLLTGALVAPVLVAVPRASFAAVATIDLKTDCGAKGDGVTDDTAAFRKAAAMAQAARAAVVNIPRGTYLVGQQDSPPNGRSVNRAALGLAPKAFFDWQPLFAVKNMQSLQINGNNATIRLKPGLRYGGFDPDGGPADITNIGRMDKERVRSAKVGPIIHIVDSSNVSIRQLEIDGNSGQLFLGGRYGDKGRQVPGTGISLNRCPGASITDCHVHHCPLDGITILHQGEKSRDSSRPVTITRTVSEYNGRQALSWIGGNGLKCTDCKFNHTGRTRSRDGKGFVVSSPGAGLDIEPNTGPEWARNGVFTRCEFHDNAGPGIVVNSGDGGYSRFVDCTVQGTTGWALWLQRPGLVFENCRIFGSSTYVNNGSRAGSPPDPKLATRFSNCRFEDTPGIPGSKQVYRRGFLYDSAIGSGATWEDCTFVAHKVASVNAADARSAKGPQPACTPPRTPSVERFIRCTFVHDAPLRPGAPQAIFHSSHLLGCKFRDGPTLAASGKRYVIQTNAAVVEASSTPALATTVMGADGKPSRVVFWSRLGGKGALTGVIPAGTYTTRETCPD